MIFAGLTMLFVILSKRVLVDVKSHGFFRLLVWECIAILISWSYDRWWVDPNSSLQIVSWVLLTISLYLVIVALIMLRKRGKPDESRGDRKLYDLERTTRLITTGIFRFIRHPMYSSLLFLSWGIWLKNPVWPLLLVTIVSSVLIVIASLIEEKECIAYFGDPYREYMRRTRRFIPFLV